MPGTCLLLIRHGQSTWNQAGIWQGWADPPLSDLGFDQAHEAGRALATLDRRFAAVVSSDLNRAKQTAQIIATHLGLESVRTDPDLRERDMGQWSGLKTEEIAIGWPGQLQAFKSGDLAGPPEGEDHAHLLARAQGALTRLAGSISPGNSTDLDKSGPSTIPDHDRSVIAVTHGGLIRTVERALGLEHPVTANLGGRWLRLGPHGALKAGPIWEGSTLRGGILASQPRTGASGNPFGP
ncbi:MAG: histidine phosphatase family protein [Acidimicrobiales bacterium]